MGRLRFHFDSIDAGGGWICLAAVEKAARSAFSPMCVYPSVV